MKDITRTGFYYRLINKKEHYPWICQIEFTYRCNLNCVHCYCKGSEDKDKELTTQEWKKIIDEIQKEGCIFLLFTGGEPLVRDDFLEIYTYAKEKGLIIGIFTNGTLFTEGIVNYFKKLPPASVEITLNSITPDTYEAITQIKGSFERVMDNIKRLKENKIPLILKTNCLKQNKHEIGKIKRWTEELLGKPSNNRYHFKYDPAIYPRLNGDKAPCNYRLSFKELLKVRKQDPDLWQQHQKTLHGGFPDLKRDSSFLYHCNSWMKQFFVNPYGKLKFCIFSDKFSVSLKTASFKEGFYKVSPQLLRVQFKTDSRCKDCSLRPICWVCPARAYLETGDEEAPVPYYCELAKEMAREVQAKLPNCQTVCSNLAT